MKIILFLVIAPALFALPVSRAQDIDSLALYQNYCSVCHGDKGDGNSLAKQGMMPPPRDFTSPQSAIELSAQRIRLAIREGVPETAMSGWKSRLSEAEIDALADFVRTRFMLSSSVETASEGSKIYAAYCSVCHGDSGKGAIWAAAGLSPKPVDFTSAEVQAALSRDHMIHSVSYGRPETAMTGWKKRLTDQQIATVVDYVIDAFMPGSKLARKSGNADHDHSQHQHTAPGVKLSTHMRLPLPDGLQGNLTRGEQLYRDNCSTCHGMEGDGRGPRAYFINPKPRNFLHTASRASLNRPVLYASISKGKLRTEMPAWDKVLNAQQIADVSEFVFNRFIDQ
jgi:mono/diheme cytochrome c family protein